MLGSRTRRMLGLALPLVGQLLALTGCWDGMSAVQSAATVQQLASISLSPPDSSLAAGVAQQMTATGIYGDGSKQDISARVAWTSSRTAIAAISAGGTAIGVSPGSAAITATANGIAGTTTLTVTGAQLVSIGVTPAAPSIALGTSLTLMATGVYSDQSIHDVTNAVSWQSGTPTVAAVSSTGKVTGARVGMTVVTATLGGVTSIGVALKVSGATLVSIALTPAIVSLANGTQQQFTATGTYSDRSTQDLSSIAAWNSSAPAEATIGSNGLAMATGVGTTSITATLGGISSTAVTLNVSGATLVSIAVTSAVPSLVLGLNEQLTATGTFTNHSTQDLTTAVTWTSSATTVADISSGITTSGLVTSHAAGSTNITATLGPVSSAPVGLSVTAATLVSIGITPGAASIALGTGEQLTATGVYTDNSTQDLTAAATWASSSAAVVSVSNATGSSGLATALTVGSTTITAVSGAITSNPVTLTVPAATLVSIAITPAAPSIVSGSTQQFAAIGSYSDGSTQDLSNQVAWASDNAAVAPISNASGSSGLATALTVGSATITASSGAITSNPVTLTVPAATLVSIAITPAAPSIALGSTQQFAATGTYSDSSTQDVTTQVAWASDNAAVAAISNVPGTQGLASGASAGTADISATLGSVGSASITVTVTSANLVSILFIHPPLTWRLGDAFPPQFQVIGTYSDGSQNSAMTSVTWTSSDTTVATIGNAGDYLGVLTVLTAGTVQITAAVGNITATTGLTILPAIDDQ